MNERHIIAIGGGGFSSEPENPALDLYVLKRCAAMQPRVCFIPTASGDADAYLVKFSAAFSRYDCRPSHLSLFTRTPDVRSTLLEQDVIYVGGGNTKSMLAVWREWGIAEVLRAAWESGVVLAGISAGAICWFEEGITDSFAKAFSVLPCLGFLKGSCCPHYDGEAERRPAFHNFLRRGEISSGYAIDDGAAIHFQDGHSLRIVTSHANAKAYRMSAQDGIVIEEPLEAEYVGENGKGDREIGK